MRLYLRFLRIHFLSMLEYRTSFWLLSVAQFLFSIGSLVSIFMLFERFSSLKGWSLWEVALCFCLSQVSFSIAEMFTRGFDRFSVTVIRGEFDRVLLRPRNIILQILCSQFEFSRIGRLISGLLALFLVLAQSNFEWTVLKAMTLVLTIIGGTALFSAIFVFGATLCFFSTQSLEFINIFTDGGREFTKYPVDIYPKPLRLALTIIIPYALMNYYPLLYLTGRVASSAIGYALAPLLCFLFFIPALIFFSRGAKKYLSTGS